jgi:methanogenic corrinoid protein MtbC1
MSAGSELLAEAIREAAPRVAVEVTDEFLERHPDWRLRYGARATSAGVQDAGYHLAFLAGAVESGSVSAFVNYARWAARVLAARGIPSRFLAENLQQIWTALAARLGSERAAGLSVYFEPALQALSSEVELPSAGALSLTADVFLQAILGGQRHAAVQIAREALREGRSMPDLYLDVFQPAMYEVGARWEANQLTVAQEHIATAITQYVMAQIYEPPARPATEAGTVILTGVEGELHNIGTVMVGDLLESSGWRVRFLGTNLPASSILATVRDAQPSHVGISATMLFNVNAVRQLIKSIRSEYDDRIRILVGGAAFRTTPELWREVEADGFAADLRAVPAAFNGQA